ncbi:MAG: DMT family transporter [Candidatus Latescibacteria bacterium]|nr:DMT family transporter [Candidatus Latescibacterota bacterium]
MIPLQAAFFALFLSFLWGGLAPAIRIGLTGAPPIALAGLRFAAGLVAIAGWCWWRGIPLRIRRGEEVPLAALTALFITQIVCLNVGTSFTSAAHSTVLLNTHPIFVALLAHVFFPDDRLSGAKLTGLTVSFIGIVAVFADRWTGMKGIWFAGDLMLLLSSFLLGAILVSTKLLIRRINLYKLLIYQMLLGSPVFFIVSLIVEGTGGYHLLSPSILLAIAYQGFVVAAFCFVGWTHLLDRYPASKLTAFSFTTPIFGVGLSYLLLGEPITMGLVVGVTLVTVGIHLVNRG